MALPSPVVAGWELVLRLRERREQVGIEVKHITQALGFSRNYWSAVENERRILSEESLKKLIDLLEFSDEEREEMLELREHRQGPWLVDRLFRVVRRRVAAFVRSGARSAQHSRLREPDDSRVAADRRLRACRHSSVCDGAAGAGRATGGCAACAARNGSTTTIRCSLTTDHQRGRATSADRWSCRAAWSARAPHRHDRQVPGEPRVHVVPFTAQACSLVRGATVYLIDFENPRLPTVVWQETVTAWGVIDDHSQVDAISAAFDRGASAHRWTGGNRRNRSNDASKELS